MQIITIWMTIMVAGMPSVEMEELWDPMKSVMMGI
jgi:hypothetical protein